MDPEKVRAIEEWEAPTSVRGIRSFLGFANYYRSFIQGFATVATPLTNLTKKGTEFKWSEECQRVFDWLKERFIRDPVLTTYDPEKRNSLGTRGFRMGLWRHLGTV